MKMNFSARSVSGTVAVVPVTVGLLILSMGVGGSALAETVPEATPRDARVKEVVYNRDDVVKIVGAYGYSTNIEFGSDETVSDIAGGDPNAWEVAPSGSHLFVRPMQDGATTNYTILTNRRVYEFSLDARKQDGVSSGRTKELYFKVRFRYPDDEAAARKTVADAKQREADSKRLQSLMQSREAQKNWNYYGCGDRTLLPAEVSDDGRFTFFRFPASQEIPAVFVIASDGEETRANGNMSGDYFVVQQTAPKFVLRRGKAVSCVENRSYNQWGVYTPTKTASPQLERTIKANAPKIEDVPPPATGIQTAIVPAAPRPTGANAPSPAPPPSLINSPPVAVPAKSAAAAGFGQPELVEGKHQ